MTNEPIEMAETETESTESTTVELLADDTIVPNGMYMSPSLNLDVFHWIGDGGRTLLRIGVNAETLEIYIGTATGDLNAMDPDAWKLTKGIAKTRDDGTIRRGSISRYMKPRIATMMGRAYVPQS
jgi:hypothetical protein